MVYDHGEKMLIEDIKEKSIGPPDVYPGGKMRRFKIDNGSKAWAFRYSKYLVEAVNNVEAYLASK